MSANGDLITVRIYTTREKINSQFFINGSECETFYIFWLFRVCVGGGGDFNDQTGPILLSSYPFYDHVK